MVGALWQCNTEEVGNSPQRRPLGVGGHAKPPNEPQPWNLAVNCSTYTRFTTWSKQTESTTNGCGISTSQYLSCVSSLVQFLHVQHIDLALHPSTCCMFDLWLYSKHVGGAAAQVSVCMSGRKIWSGLRHQVPHLRKWSGPPDPQGLWSHRFGPTQMRNVIKWVSSSRNAVLSFLPSQLRQAWSTHILTDRDRLYCH